jgi:hypothetical protein
MSCGMCRPGLAPLGRRFPDKSKKGARKVGLVGEATFERNLVKWSIRCQQETLGPLHPAQHYEAVWRTAKAARECPRKVPRTQAYQRLFRFHVRHGRLTARPDKRPCLFFKIRNKAVCRVPPVEPSYSPIDNVGGRIGRRRQGTCGQWCWRPAMGAVYVV